MINVDDCVQKRWAFTNWPHAVDKVKAVLHDEASKVLFCGAVDDMFFFARRIRNSTIKQAFDSCEQWIGVTHQHREFLREETFDCIDQYIKKCKCLITLSDYMKTFWLERYPDMKVYNLYHPVQPRKYIFNMDQFITNGVIRCVGSWSRRYDIWEQLQSPYKKQSSKDNFLHFRQFDQTFVNTIQFLDVHDASANNAVIECIQRNTPLLTRRHPAIVEYLGEYYPFYFDDITQANEKINCVKTVIETHKYLSNMDKKFIQIDTFVDSISSLL